MRRIVVVGGTSEIAQKCIDVWLKTGPVHFVLTGRGREKLSRVVKDYRIRFPDSKFEPKVFDHISPLQVRNFINHVSLVPIDMILVAHGSLTSQSRAVADERYLWREHEINAISPILFAELFSGVLERQGYGRLAVIGSVAGDRGRAINYAYGAGKAALATYVSGIQHRISNPDIKVSLIKPGPTRTPMTIGSHIGPASLAEPRVVAEEIVVGILKGKRVIYAPKKWRAFMLIIKILPFRIFKLLKF